MIKWTQETGMVVKSPSPEKLQAWHALLLSRVGTVMLGAGRFCILWVGGPLLLAAGPVALGGPAQWKRTNITLILKILCLEVEVKQVTVAITISQSHTAGGLDALGSIPVNGATVCFLLEWGVGGVNFAWCNTITTKLLSHTTYRHWCTICSQYQCKQQPLPETCWMPLQHWTPAL